MTPVVRPLPPDFVLKTRAHETPDDGLCAMEAVAWVAGEPHSDHPACACPVISTFVRAWNDDIRGDEHRTRLLAPYIGQLVGTKSTSLVEHRRSVLALDWLARVQTPAWFDLSPGLQSHAAALRSLAPLISPWAIGRSVSALDDARDDASALKAARAANRPADAVAELVGPTGLFAARIAAWATYRRVADLAQDAALDAARCAAEGALQLQERALVLLDRMLAVTPDMTDEAFAALCQWEKTL